MGVGIAVWLEAKQDAKDHAISVFLPRSAVNDALATLQAAGNPKVFHKKGQQQRDDLKVRRGGMGGGRRG